MDKASHREMRWLPYLTALLLMLLLEVFLFNFRYWQSRGYEPTEIPIDTALVSGASLEKENGIHIFTPEAEEPFIVGFDLSAIPEKIHNVAIDAYCSNGTAGFMFTSSPVVVPITIDMTEVTVAYLDGEEYREMPVRYAGRYREELSVFALPGNADVRALILKIRPMYPSSLKVSFSRCLINCPATFHFSFLRFFVLFCLSFLLIAFRPNSLLWKTPIFGDHAGRSAAFLTGRIFFILLFTGVFIFLCKNNVVLSSEEEIRPFYNDLAIALSHGSLSLEIEPDPKLEAMNNPYDPAERSAYGVSYPLDYSYYNGKYYIYFGIVPCILFYLPALVFFHTELLSWQVLCILCPIFLFGLAILLEELMKRYRPGASVALYWMLYLLAGAGVSLFQFAANSTPYNVPIFTAVTLFVYGFYFYLLARRRIDGNKNEKGYLFIGSLLMALIAGCRPQMILGAAVVLPVLFPVFVSKKENRKRILHINRLFFFLIPYLIVAAGLMLYNFLRFGSVFEFGLHYQLTLFVGKKNIYGINILAGICYYLLRIPDIQKGFPYITFAPFGWENPHGLANNASGVGLFFLYPYLWAFLFSLTGWKKNGKKEGRELKSLALILFGTGAVLLIIASNMMGLVDRYRLDFTIFFALAAVISMLGIDPVEERKKKRICIRLCSVLLCICMISALAVYFVPTEVSDLREVNQHFYTDIARLITFWQ